MAEYSTLNDILQRMRAETFELLQASEVRINETKRLLRKAQAELQRKSIYPYTDKEDQRDQRDSSTGIRS